MPWVHRENKDDDAEWNGHEDLELKVFLGLIVKKVEMIGVNFYIILYLKVIKKIFKKIYFKVMFGFQKIWGKVQGKENKKKWKKRKTDGK